MKKHFLFLLALAAALLVLALAFPGSASRTETAQPETLTASILKVGKADAIILQNGSGTMVIDAGEEDDGEEVVEFLVSRGISEIEALIITHFDKDHVGGADTLVEQIDVNRVLLPDYEGSGTEYQDFLAALSQKSIEPERIDEAVTFDFGSTSVLVEPPESYEMPNAEEEYDNNFSLITTVTHNRNRLLFTGDIEKQRIREWLGGQTAVRCDFLKVPHHGVYNTALEEFFRTVRPSCAAICSSAKNPADEQTLELLTEMGVDVRETKDGDITVISDGEKIEIRQ